MCDNLDYLQDLATLRVAVQESLRVLENEMSPCNWTIMFHLLEHMPEQIQQWGPTRETWMFCMESYFGKLVRMIRNRQHPIANVLRSIAVSKAVRACVAISRQADLVRTRGFAPPLRLPPSVPCRDSDVNLGGRQVTVVTSCNR